MKEQHFYRDGDQLIRMAKWDREFSKRHRTWGQECCAYDVDQMLTFGPPSSDGVTYMESNYGQVYGLVEYKHENALYGNRDYYYQLKSLAWLADGREIPAFCCYYRRKDYAIYVVPLNEYARYWIAEAGWMTERMYVMLLYAIRRLEPEMEALMKFNATRPEEYLVKVA